MLRGFMCVWGSMCVLVTEVRENVLWAEIMMRTLDFFCKRTEANFVHVNLLL